MKVFGRDQIISIYCVYIHSHCGGVCVHVCACMYLGMYVFVKACVRVNDVCLLYIYIYTVIVYVCVCLYVYIYVYLRMDACMYIGVYVYMHTCMYVSTEASLHIRRDVYMHVFIHTHAYNIILF